MAIWAELRKRRVFGFLGAYIAAGFLVLEGVDQAVGNDILPGLAYRLVLVFYLFGIAGTTIIAWFHGEKGTQKPTPIEIWLHAVLLVAALAVSWNIVGAYRATTTAMESGLDPRRVAVLYFEDVSGDGGLGYVADGLTEALIDQLSQVRALDVISRNGVAPFRDIDAARDSIARALEAGSLIEGTVESVGGELRMTARLVDGMSGADLERTSFRVPAGEFLAARDSVSQRVGRILRQRLGEEVRLRERRAGTASVEAWALVQRAERLRKQAEEQLRDDRFEEALANFELADSVLALAEGADPDWVESIALRAHTAFRRSRTARYLDDTPMVVDAIEAGIAHADRALEIEPNHGPALEYRGTLYYWHWLIGLTPDPDERDRLFSEARQDLEAAVRADPTLATAHSLLSHLYINTEDRVAVVLAARRAYEEDAYLGDADQVLLRLFWGHYNLEQITEAQRWADEGLRRFPDDYLFLEAQLYTMVTDQVEPDVDRAWQLARRLEAATPEVRRPFYGRRADILAAGVIGRAGDMDSAQAVLARPRPGPEVDPHLDLLADDAIVRGLIGDADGAIAVLREYVAANPQAFASGEEADWVWRPLRDHPDFQALVASSRR